MPDISIGRLRGGFCVSWQADGKRRRYQLAARTRAAAEAEAIDVYRRETYAPGGMSVEAIWAAYLMYLGDKPTARTMRSTGVAVLDHFGHLRPDQISDDHCHSYTAKRTDAGKKQGTIHTELGHLKSALRFAHKKRMIERLPDIERPSKPTPKERFLTRAEIGRLLDATGAPHIHLAVNLMLSTAARVGAALDLTWDRVDFERGQINLRLPDSVTRKGRAIVPINGGLRAELTIAREAALSDYVVEYAARQVKSIRKGFGLAVERAGLHGVTLHTLRHTSAVHMVQDGIPIEKVAQFLGHSNVAITYSTYARYSPDHLRDAAEILDFTSLRNRTA